MSVNPMTLAFHGRSLAVEEIRRPTSGCCRAPIVGSQVSPTKRKCLVCFGFVSEKGEPIITA